MPEPTLPTPIRAFIDAAVETDLDGMFAQIDWQASKARAWVDSIDSPYLPADRANELIERGFREFEDVNPSMVKSQLGEMSLKLGLGGAYRPATDEESARVLDALRVPTVKRSLSLKIVKRLDEWRARAAAAGPVWALVTERNTYWLALSGDRKKAMLVQLPASP
jgi:hypothetical protein